MLKSQNGRKGNDAWTSYQGKVYNISLYLPYHPGGKGELLRGAGKDATKLFVEVHPWVNWDAILGECLVGSLVLENEGSPVINAPLPRSSPSLEFPIPSEYPLQGKRHYRRLAVSDTYNGRR